MILFPKIYLDIETIPTQHQDLVDYIGESVKPPGNMKKAETIAKWELEEKPEAIINAVNSSALDGCFNHIVCIGFAFDDLPVETLYIDNVNNEADMLHRFYDRLKEHYTMLSGKTWVGHNIIGFDLPVLKQRSILLGVKPPPSIPNDGKPWEKNPFDTMTQWDKRNFVKLEKLAKVMGFEAKSMNGADVYQAWKEKREADIRSYCAGDVELVRKIHARMEFLTPVDVVVSAPLPKGLNLY